MGRPGLDFLDSISQFSPVFLPFCSFLNKFGECVSCCFHRPRAHSQRASPRHPLSPRLLFVSTTTATCAKGRPGRENARDLSARDPGVLFHEKDFTVRNMKKKKRKKKAILEIQTRHWQAGETKTRNWLWLRAVLHASAGATPEKREGVRRRPRLHLTRAHARNF